MSYIQIDYGEMRAVAGDFQVQSDTTQDIINALNTRTGQLMAGWEGVAEQSFMEELNSCLQRMSRVPGMLSQISQALYGTADAIQRAEEEAARAAQMTITGDNQ